MEEKYKNLFRLFTIEKKKKSNEKREKIEKRTGKQRKQGGK